MPNKIMVFSTAPSEEVAAAIARAVVQEELAACVNILPGITSVYRWRGAVDISSEFLLIFKTRGALFEALRARIVALHPYEVPEVVAVPITAGHTPYLEWIDESTEEH